MRKLLYYKQSLAASLLVFLLLCSGQVQAQDKHTLDSLKKEFRTARYDTLRAHLYIKIAEEFITAKQTDSSVHYLEKSLALSNKNLPTAKGKERTAFLNHKAMALFAKGTTMENSKTKSAGAEALYKESIELYTTTNNRLGLATVTKRMGSYYRAEGRYDDALPRLEKALGIFQELKNKREISQCYMFMADVWRDKGQYNNALDHYKKAIAIKEEINDSKSLGNAYNNIAYVYNLKGEIKNSLDYYYKSLKLREKIKDKPGMGLVYINTGDIYFKQGDTAHALENFGKALKLGEEINDKRTIAGASMYFGFYHQAKKEDEKALEYYNKTLALREEIKDKSGQAYCLFNMSKLFMNKGDTATANTHFNKAYSIWKSMGDKRGIAGSLIYMGEEYLKKNDLQKADEYATEALTVAQSAGIKESTKLAYLLRSKIALAKAEYRNAYTFYERGISIRDSLVNNENKKAALEKDLEYQYEKKQALLEVEKEKQDFFYREELKRKQLLFDLEVEKENNQHALEKKELAHQEDLKRKQLKSEFEKTKEITRIETEKQQLLAETKSRQQRNVIALVSVGLVIVIIFLALLFNRFRLIKKQKNIIESQKQQVEHQHAEISEQKLILEEKNKEIIDSINYAKRLQEAILPPASFWEQQLPQSFIYYKPKDIVAGDFYFMEQSQDKLIFAAADSTGHGVPGAMVSVVCSNALTRAVKEFNLTHPGKILDKVRELVMETFSKSESDVKDGMDISLCVFDKKTKNLEWAGANNPLWLFRPRENQDHEFVELKPDKQPVGKTTDPRPFSSHTIATSPGDIVYLFTDGYSDQFGGDKGKKFKSANMRELISTMVRTDMRKQKDALSHAFEKWRGDLEQVDDICVIGIKI